MTHTSSDTRAAFSPPIEVALMSRATQYKLF